MTTACHDDSHCDRSVIKRLHNRKSRSTATSCVHGAPAAQAEAAEAEWAGSTEFESVRQLRRTRIDLQASCAQSQHLKAKSFDLEVTPWAPTRLTSCSVRRCRPRLMVVSARCCCQLPSWRAEGRGWVGQGWAGLWVHASKLICNIAP